MLASLDQALFNNKMITKREAETISTVGDLLSPERRLGLDEPELIHVLARRALLGLRKPIETDWHILLPRAEVSLELFEDMLDKVPLIEYLSNRTTVDDLYGCWSVPLTAEYDEAGRARYPNINVAQFSDTGVTTSVHRLVWKTLFDPAIKRDLHIDHLCRVHACFNPTHIEAVPGGVNITRGQEARRRISGQMPLFYAEDRW